MFPINRSVRRLVYPTLYRQLKVPHRSFSKPPLDEVKTQFNTCLDQIPTLGKFTNKQKIWLSQLNEIKQKLDTRTPTAESPKNPTEETPVKPKVITIDISTFHTKYLQSVKDFYKQAEQKYIDLDKHFGNERSLGRKSFKGYLFTFAHLVFLAVAIILLIALGLLLLFVFDTFLPEWLNGLMAITIFLGIIAFFVYM
jgi:hypothetical protein